MSSHPDADSFVRAILRDPADVTTRLVFADWLEETDEPANVAWARFIRLMVEANRHAAGSPERADRELEAAAYWWQIDAKLMLPGRLFIAASEAFLQLLPPWSLTVKLKNCEVPKAIIELMPESVSREHLILPLDLQGNLLLIASADPGNCDTIQLLQYILNKDVIAVRAEITDIQNAINHHYGQTEFESVFEELVIFDDAPPPAPDPSREPTGQVTDGHDYLDDILAIARSLGASVVTFVPELNGMQLGYRVGTDTIQTELIPHSDWQDTLLPEVIRRGEITGTELVVEVIQRGHFRAANIRLLPLSVL